MIAALKTGALIGASAIGALIVLVIGIVLLGVLAMAVDNATRTHKTKKMK